MKLLNEKRYAISIVILFVFFMFYKPVFCFIMIGLIIVIAVIDSWFLIVTLQKIGIESTAQILHYVSDDDGHKTPIIEFTTSNGNQIKSKPYYYASTDLSIIRTYKNKINTSIDIIYHPKNPEKFVIKKERFFNYFILIFMLLGAITFLIVGTLSLLGIIQIKGF